MYIFIKKKIILLLRILRLLKLTYILCDIIKLTFDKNYKTFSAKVKNLEFIKKEKINKDNKNLNVLMLGFSEFNTILLQTTQIIALKQLGYKIIIILSSPSIIIEKLYRKLGVDSFIYYFDFINREFHRNLSTIFNKKISQSSFLNLKYKGVEVGKISMSTLMRKKLVSRFDIENIDYDLVSKALSQSMFFSDFSEMIINRFQPKMILFMDRGYSPEGEIFNFAIKKKIPAIELHVGHKSGLLIFKKYFLKNKNMHYASLSKKTWNQVKKKPVKNKKKLVLDELNSCYKNGTWYDEVGTQFNKKNFSKKEFFKKFNLNPKYKTVVIFSHIFWDATFFFGNDIFFDYQEWLIQTIKQLSLNKNINCLIKLHPAHSVKNKRNKKIGSFEKNVIFEEIKNLPNHIKIIDYNNEITTLSLLRHIDYCITVRGTVGIEAACLGVPVLLAGTGRYDNLGFTIDHKNKREYLNSLSKIQKIKKYSKKQNELAIKYAYTLLFERNIVSEILNFKYKKDPNATLIVNINKSYQNVDDSKEIINLMNWFQNENEDFLN